MTEPEWMDDWRRTEKRKPPDRMHISMVVATSFGEIMRGDPGFEEVYIDALETQLEEVKRENKRWLRRFKWW